MIQQHENDKQTYRALAYISAFLWFFWYETMTIPSPWIQTGQCSSYDDNANTPTDKHRRCLRKKSNRRTNQQPRTQLNIETDFVSISYENPTGCNNPEIDVPLTHPVRPPEFKSNRCCYSCSQLFDCFRPRLSNSLLDGEERNAESDAINDEQPIINED